MTEFTSFSDLCAACLDLPSGHPAASAAVTQREDTLTKPPQSLGRLEDLTAFLAHWQGHAPPRLERVDILVFAGNHGVTRQGVSAYPAEVTAQMVANFAAGGAAINQLARAAGASLRVIPLALEAPTADFTEGPALDEQEFLAAVALLILRIDSPRGARLSHRHGDLRRGRRLRQAGRRGGRAEGCGVVFLSAPATCPPKRVARRRKRWRGRRHCERSEAIQSSKARGLDCFVAEPVIGPATSGDSASARVNARLPIGSSQ